MGMRRLGETGQRGIGCPRQSRGCNHRATVEPREGAGTARGPKPRVGKELTAASSPETAWQGMPQRVRAGWAGYGAVTVDPPAPSGPRIPA
jgi:hypothetical protein